MRTLLTVFFAAAVLFCSRSSQAFRTGANLPELETDAVVRWESTRVEFVVGGELPHSFRLEGLGPTLRDAMAVWNEAACGTIALTERGVSGTQAARGDGINTISFVYHDWQSFGSNDAAATTDVVYERRGDGPWAIVEADIYLNAQDFGWDPGAQGAAAQNIYIVLMHELGHALGLLHPCEIGGADGAEDCGQTSAFDETLMFPAYRADIRRLATDDRAGLCYLYGCSETCSSGPGPCEGSLCVPPTCDTEETCATAVCADHPQCTGASPLGDPCDKSADCRSGFCTTQNHCAPRCNPTACNGTECSAACEESGSPLGAACQDSSTCLGNECLAGAGPTSVCTRACNTLADDCPGNWVCFAVEAEPVCVPPDHPVLFPTGGGGCSVRSTQAPGHAAWIVALMLLGRSRRRSCRSTPKSKS